MTLCRGSQHSACQPIAKPGDNHGYNFIHEWILLQSVSMRWIHFSPSIRATARISCEKYKTRRPRQGAGGSGLGVRPWAVV